MQFAVVIFPEIPINDIDAVRKRFDPQCGRIAPHITLVFPTSLTFGTEQLSEHLRQIAARWEPFPIRLHGLRREWTHWLVLDVPEGAAQIEGLHDALYTGPLADSLRGDVPYLPHLTLGVFRPTTDPAEASVLETRWKEAWTAASALPLDFTCTVWRISLLAISDKEIATVREFEFQGEPISLGG
jgi:2'-5' RNA ligase